MSAVRSPRLLDNQRGRADPEAQRGRWRLGGNPLDDVVQVQQQAPGMVWHWFEGNGADRIVVPAHRVEVRLCPDCLGHRPNAVKSATTP